jgi:hypothetical protein
MSAKWGRGSTAILPVFFREGGSGELIDADPVRVDILDPNDTQVVTDAVPTTHPFEGTYTYNYAIAGGAVLGVWTVHWTGVINGIPVEGDYLFEVVAPGSVSFGSDPLCDLDEFALYLGFAIPVEDTDRATLALKIASENFRNASNQPITAVADEIEILDGTDGDTLLLAHWPVSGITTVEVDVVGGVGTELDEADFYTYPDGRLVRRFGTWGSIRQGVRVTYSNGYATIPEDICGVVLENAKRIYRGDQGIQSESVSSHSVTFVDSPSAGLNDAERRIAGRYRSPASG